jgi:gas vesicle protein
MKKKSSHFFMGAGVATAAAAGLVAWFTQTKQGKALGKHAEKYVKDITKTLSHATQKMTNVSKKEYEVLVDELVDQYKVNKKLTRAAAEELSNTLKKQWNQIKKELVAQNKAK